MKKTILILLLFTSLIVNGQPIKKGLYKGWGMTIATCYLNYSDTLINFEYFQQKGCQIFGHFPAVKLNLTLESSNKKPFLISEDSTIKVYIKKDYFVVKDKNHGKAKVYLSNETQKEIDILRNRNSICVFNNKITKELQNNDYYRLNYINDSIFYSKLHQYNLNNFTNIKTTEFDVKLEEIRLELLNEFTAVKPKKE